MIAGYLGSSKSLEYTVIGDSVNTASRLCSAAKAGEIIISRSTYDKVKDYFEIEELPRRSSRVRRCLTGVLRQRARSAAVLRAGAVDEARVAETQLLGCGWPIRRGVLSLDYRGYDGLVQWTGDGSGVLTLTVPVALRSELDELLGALAAEVSLQVLPGALF